MHLSLGAYHHALLLRFIKRPTAGLLVLLFITSPFNVAAAQESVPSDPMPEVNSDPAPSASVPVDTSALESAIESTPPSEAAPEEATSPISSATSESTSDGAVTAGAEEEAPPTEEEGKGEEDPPQILMSGGDDGPTANDPTFTYKSIAPKVDRATGALVQSLPLSVPPGRNGLEPDLALAYNSQQLDESIVGYGWSVNIPYIERINRQGLNKMYSQDYFFSSLGGTGELASTSVANEYRAKVENGNFLQYVYASTTGASASSSWTVYDKKGTKYTFGVTAQARQDDPNNSYRVARWMLEEVRDTNDNFIRFTYYKEGGQIYPDTVYYTGNGAADGPFTVAFSREARPDTITSYRAGFLATTTYRINRIEAKVSGTWVHRYDLAYTSGNNDKRSLLQSVTQSGQDEAGASTDALPAVTFQYVDDTVAFTSSSANMNGIHKGFLPADGDGNGFVDVNASVNSGGGSPTFIGKNYGAMPTTESFCCNAGVVWAHTSTYEYLEQGARYFDINGDGKADGLSSYYDGVINLKTIYWNNGDWTWSQEAATPTMPYFADGNGTQGFFANLNGDGIIDFEGANTNGSPTANGPYLGTGGGFASSTGFWPVDLIPLRGTADTSDNRLLDINGDGLDDWVKNNTSNDTIEVRLNNGSGWETTADTRWTIATTSVWVDGGAYTNGIDRGVRFVDLNGDGLVDFIRAYKVANYPSGTHTGYSPEVADVKFVMLNTGSGWATSTMTVPFYILEGNIVQGYFEGFIQGEMWDWSGDGLWENVVSGTAYKNTARKSDMLATTTYPTGGYTSVTYSASNAVGDMESNNPFPVYVVTSVTNNDANGHAETINYGYAGGSFYYNGPYDRKIAGFQSITETHADRVIKDFYHQGNTASTTLGEYDEHVSKIGKVFREDVTDVSSNVFKRTFHTWDRLDQGNNRNFVFISTTTEITFDGDADHKDTATRYLYATSTGDLIQRIFYGEVNASTSGGSFSDTGTDLASTTILYAASSSVNMSLPYQETTEDQGSAKVKETRYYYDTLGLGSVNVGNRTKKESLISGSTYASTTKSYNSYGLATQDTDARGKTTTYVYDTHNLYVATATNPLSQSTGYVYDYSSGKVKQVTDANNRVFQYVLDPLDRLSEEKQPDITTPGTLVTKAAYTYTENATSTQVLKTSYLNSATSSLLYTHFDGFGRILQTRKETGGSNTYAVKDYIYGTTGKLAKESLPYFASSTAVSAATTNGKLLTTYAYDALGRISTTTTVVGTTTVRYDDWRTTTTDTEGNEKDLYRDAYGNLVTVVEHNGAAATTSYEYDRLGNLTKITDALGNVRNFTYDNLGRRLTAEDLHAVADTTYGTSTFSYDAAGNLTSRIDPNGRTIAYTYDDINRVLTEDDTSQSGTEISYGYDACTNGAGRLCAATSTAGTVVTNYAYNALGGVSAEAKTIGPNSYTTSYDYDRQGNTTLITYPDGSQTQYLFNEAARVTAVNHRDSLSSPYSAIISAVYYSPLEQPTFIKFGNGVETVRTYNADKLYRLTNIRTTAVGTSTTGTGGIGGGLGLLEDFARYLAKATTKLPLALQTATTLLSTSSEQDLLFATTTSQSATSTPATSTDATAFDTTVQTVDEPPPGSIRALITNKSAHEKANIKGFEIAKLGTIPRTERAHYDIEIEALESIDGGVQAYVRAWNKYGQIGFGTDGSVDLERFRIINPPILVDDPEGDIIQQWTDRWGERRDRRLREDPKEALLQVIEHNLSAMKNVHGSARIVSGKRGNTVSTFYPDPHPESSSVDGGANRDIGNPGVSFATLRSGAATVVQDSTTSGGYVGLQDSSPTGNKIYWARSIFLFDTSSIPDTATITAATLSLYGNNKRDDNTSQWAASAKDLEIVSSSPASNTSLAGSDFDIGDFGTTSFGTVTYANWSTTSYNDITLNENGLDNISLTGASKFGALIGAEFDNIDPGTGATNGFTGVDGYFSDQAGTTKDPKLVVEHSSTPGEPEPLVLQDISYAYDSVGNITSMQETATSTGLSRSVSYAYDHLYRLTYASTTAASTSPYAKFYTYDALGNITGSSGGAPSILNTYSLDLERSSGQYAYHADDSAFDITGDMTLAAWVNVEDAPTSGQFYGIITKWDCNANSSYTLAYRNNAGTFQIHFDTSSSGGNSDSVNINQTLTAGTWYHIAVAYTASSGNVTIYVNGSSIGSDTTFTSVFNGNAEFRIGNYNCGDVLAFDGLIDDVRLWARALLDTEVSTLHSSPGSFSNGSLLMGWWQLDNNYSDASGFGNTLTAVNSPTFNDDVPFNVPASGVTYAYDGSSSANPHAVTSIGNGTATSTHVYDQAGNLLSNASTTNTWDWRNRLTRTVTGTTTNYLYDENDQRVQYHVPVGAATTTVNYANKLFNETLYDWPGTTTATTTLKTTKHIFLGDLLVATIEAATSTGTTTYYVHADHLGGTNVVTNASGTVAELADYLPYGGQRISQQNENLSEQRKFAGTEFDPDTTYSYMQARYYDSAVGRFISQDPVFLAVGNPNAIQQLAKVQQEKLLMDPQLLNSYSYGRNNPITHKDPEGRIVQFLALPAASAILDLIASGFTIGAGIKVTESFYSNIALPFAYPHAFTHDEKIDAPIRFGVDAFLNLGSNVLPTQAGQVLLDTILSGAEYLPDDRKSGSKKGADPAQWIYDAVKNRGASPSTAAPQSVKAPQSATGVSGIGQYVSVPGTNISRSKEAVGTHNGAPVYCWGRCSN